MYTQMPNHFIDNVMKHTSPSATMCYMVICRYTIGWQKDTDTIAISQFCELTGLTKPTVLKALRELIDIGAIFVQRSGRGKEYGINNSITIDRACCNTGKETLPMMGQKTLPIDVPSKESLPVKGKKPLPTSVKEINTQKKGKKLSTTKDSRLSNWQFTVYRELTHLHVPHAFRDRVDLLTDEQLWRDVITRWIGRGYRVNNIQGILEWYDKEHSDVRRTERQNDGGNSTTIEQYIEANRKWLEPL